MDGREAMTYYMQRGMGGSGSGNQAGGVHGSAGIRPFSGPGLPVQSHAGGGSAGFTFPVETSMSPHGSNMSPAPSMSSGEPVKRKRGRPRKYGPDGGGVSLALSPMSSTPPQTAASGGSAPSTQKRGRGRPPGSGKKQQLASLGEWLSGSAGIGFTPHVVTISVGEDIAARIMSFSQQGPRAICILSANGSVSTVTLRQPATSGGTVTYEGRFEILCLSGSYLLSDSGGSRSRTGGLSIALSSPDGRVIGGGVGGLLIAATPVQVIVGSFTHGGTKSKNKSNAGPESGVEGEPSANEKSTTPTSGAASQGLPLPSMMGGWPGSRPMDLRNAPIDIDLTRG